MSKDSIKDEEVMDEDKKKGGRKRDRGKRFGRRKSDPINDVTTYLGKTPASAMILEQVNSYSFEQFIGQQIDVGTIASTDSYTDLAALAQVVVNPAAGFTSSTTPKSDGINIQAMKWYSYLSAKNGKTTNYGPEDVMMLLLALGNVLSMFSLGARGLGLMFAYNKRNRAFPETSIEAAGFEYASLRDNLADYKIAYNVLVNKFNKIPVPANIEYFAKCAKMFQGIYLDEDGSSMAQAYCFVPETYWLFDEAYAPTGSGLKTVTLLAAANPRGMQTVPYASYLTALESQIDALLNSTTFNYIYADIMRLFEQGLRPFILSTVDYNYGILPAKVDELSIWLNNCVVLGSPEANPETVGTLTFTPSNDVVANAGNATIQYRPQFRKPHNWTGFTPILNFKTETPDLASRVYATRLCAALNMRPSTDMNTFISIEATLCDWYVVRINMSAGYTSLSVMSDSMVGSTAVAGVRSICALYEDLSKFDWHPYVYNVIAASGIVTGRIKVFGDTQYFTTITRTLLKKIQDICLMNMFDF